MLPVLLFVCTLFLAVLLFALSERTVLPSAVAGSLIPHSPSDVLAARRLRGR